jgi:hypothetical protein
VDVYGVHPPSNEPTEMRPTSLRKPIIGPCHVSGIFLPLRVNSLPLATIYEVKIPLQKWKKSLLQRNPVQMTWANITQWSAKIIANVLTCRKLAQPERNSSFNTKNETADPLNHKNL